MLGVLSVLAGLAVGWCADNPYLGLLVVWILLALLELFSHGESHS